MNSAFLPGQREDISHPFPPEAYHHIGLDQLVTFCVDRILASREECTFERLVYECFILFPEKFRFERYPDWPDSARVNKAWLRCRTDKKWIAGSVQAGFVLAPDGMRVARETAAMLGHRKAKRKTDQRDARERWEAALQQIRRHPAYAKFQKGDASELTEQDIRNVLAATLETPQRILETNLSSSIR